MQGTIRKLFKYFWGELAGLLRKITKYKYNAISLLVYQYVVYGRVYSEVTIAISHLLYQYFTGKNGGSLH
jgi:hypothetical protein